MDWVAVVVLALVQGLTEFLPISSSAHLVLVPQFLGWQDQGLAFDVAVHLGTLLAVVSYFRAELYRILRAWLGSVVGGRPDESGDARLGWSLVAATLPVVLVGLVARDIVEQQLRMPLLIAATTALFGLLLWFADRRRGTVADEHQLSLGKAVVIGCAQVLALIPGTSRSGITITAGLWLGLSRETAARFSFLLAIPTIAGASLLVCVKLLQSGSGVDWNMLLLGVAVAAVSAFVCIRLFLGTLERIGMVPFMVYRLILAAVILYFFL